MFSDEEYQFLTSARIARLATADGEGRPHVVPICFAVVDVPASESPWITTPIDEKPQQVEPTDLQRVRNIRENPYVALVVDRYVEDWDRLGWVHVRGRARVLDPTTEGHNSGVSALRGAYTQYADHDLDGRPLLRIDPGSVRSWGHLDPFE